LEIWVFKIVSFIALLSELIYPYVSRTPRLEVGADIYLRVWRRPQKSDDVRNPIIPGIVNLPVAHSWGESAGAISVSLHMLTNNGNQEGLFRGAVMQSGGPIPVGDIENGQNYYDLIVKETGCKGARDTLDCLRKVPYNTYKRAMDASPNFFAYQVRAYPTTASI